VATQKVDTTIIKKEIRTRLLKKMKALNEAARLSKSNEIATKLLASNVFTNAKVIHFYLACATEVQTDVMVIEALRQGKRVVAPVILHHSLRLFEINDLHPAHLQLGPFGIREPIPDAPKEVFVKEVDLFIVPGVAYDRMGNRLGHGYGYYDRLLEGVKTKIIAPAFEFQLVDRLPCEPTDIKVNQIITEKEIINCKSEDK
jgi:5-formyltetrahydrofolate cyclo-ligase